MSLRLTVSLVSVAALCGVAACSSSPPAITDMTIFPADATGQPSSVSLCRTIVRPPIPVIGLRPGTDPRESTLWLNDPSTGKVGITLARGVQNFLLYCGRVDASDHFVVAIYLDNEPTASLTALVDSRPDHPVTASQAPVVQGLDGTPVANHSGQSVIRDGYQVTLKGGAFPLDDVWVDALGSWALKPDGSRDSVGVLTLDVQPVAASASG